MSTLDSFIRGAYNNPETVEEAKAFATGHAFFPRLEKRADRLAMILSDNERHGWVGPQCDGLPRCRLFLADSVPHFEEIFQPRKGAAPRSLAPDG